MGLLDAIPGLAAHEVEATVPEFDAAKAERLVSEAMGLIASLYPAGALEWLEAKRPEVVAYLKESEQEADAAALAGDRARLERALSRWTEAHKKAFAIYNELPAVIQRQETGVN